MRDIRERSRDRHLSQTFFQSSLTDKVEITSEYKESLTVSPSDILYIESVANYLSIWYFKDGELVQKRIRNTLKNIEEMLAGCQLHLFSIDRTIPVSKANIESLRRILPGSRKTS